MCAGVRRFTFSLWQAKQNSFVVVMLCKPNYIWKNITNVHLYVLFDLSHRNVIIKIYIVEVWNNNNNNNNNFRLPAIWS